MGQVAVALIVTTIPSMNNNAKTSSKAPNFRTSSRVASANAQNVFKSTVNVTPMGKNVLQLASARPARTNESILFQLYN